MKYLLLAIFSLCLCSCDYSSYVCIRNYKAPSRVYVSYDRNGQIWNNSDTLYASHLQDTSIHLRSLRRNTSDTSYTFIAPSLTETGLTPKSLGSPIRFIGIEVSPDSLCNISFEDRKRMRQLKKARVVQYKGWLGSTIVINNK